MPRKNALPWKVQVEGVASREWRVEGWRVEGGGLEGWRVVGGGLRVGGCTVESGGWRKSLGVKRASGVLLKLGVKPGSFPKP